MKKRFLLALWLIAPATLAQVAECPSNHPDAAKAKLVAGAIRVGRADDRIELAGGDYRMVQGGYDLRYSFPPNEPKWLACMYGRRGELELFKAMDHRATECALQVRESGKRVRVKMECK